MEQSLITSVLSILVWLIIGTIWALKNKITTGYYNVLDFIFFVLVGMASSIITAILISEMIMDEILYNIVFFFILYTIINIDTWIRLSKFEVEEWN